MCWGSETSWSLYACVHTCIHASIHTYIHTYTERNLSVCLEFRFRRTSQSPFAWENSLFFIILWMTPYRWTQQLWPNTSRTNLSHRGARACVCVCVCVCVCICVYVCVRVLSFKFWKKNVFRSRLSTHCVCALINTYPPVFYVYTYMNSCVCGYMHAYLLFPAVDFDIDPWVPCHIGQPMHTCFGWRIDTFKSHGMENQLTSPTCILT